MRTTFPDDTFAVPELMGFSSPAETARVYVTRASDAPEPVLISAEPGFDPMLVCRTVHESSEARDGRFRAVDCINQTAETFLADVTERAQTQTIVLTNLDQLSLALQEHFARMLTDDPVLKPHTGTRVMATVRGNVEDAIADGALLRELSRRFPLHIEVPPLRRRPSDIPILIACVAAEVSSALGVPVPDFSREALTVLSALPWRKNLSELREVLNVLVLAAEGGRLQLEDVLAHVPIDRLWTRPPESTSLREARNHFEREYIASVLSRHRGRMDEAARSLGVQRTNLYRKVRQLGIGRARFR